MEGSSEHKAVVGTNDVTIRKAVIDDDVSYVGICAFSNCSNLQTVVLPKSLFLVEQFAFYNCASLEKIDLSHLISIEGSAFCGCASLKEADLRSLDEISSRVFVDCANLKTVRFSECLEIIREGAFSHCGCLEEVFIPASVEVMKEHAFYGLAHDVVFYCQAESQPKNWNEEWNAGHCNAVVVWGVQPDERAVLHEENGCEYLLFPDGTARFNAVLNKDVCSVTIPDVITFQSDFKYSYNASNKKIQKTPRYHKEYKVLYVKSNAFCGLTKLQKVTLGANVAAQSFFFDECASLQSVEVDARNEQLKSLGGVLYDSDGKLLCYPKNKQDKKFCLPQDVQRFSFPKFNNNFLEEIEIPKNIKKFTCSRELSSSPLLSQEFSFMGKRITVKRGCAMKETFLFPQGSYVLDLSECSRLDVVYVTLHTYLPKDDILKQCNAVVRGRIAELILPQNVGKIMFDKPLYLFREVKTDADFAPMKRITYCGTIAQFLNVEQYNVNGDALLQDVYEVACKDGVVPKTEK